MFSNTQPRRQVVIVLTPTAAQQEAEELAERVRQLLSRRATGEDVAARWAALAPRLAALLGSA